MLPLQLTSPYREDSFTLFPYSGVETLPQETAFTHFSCMTPSHGLQFFTNCSSVDPFHSVQSFRNRLLCSGYLHRVTSPASKPAPAWALLSMSPAKSLLQNRFPTGSRSPLDTCTFSRVESSRGCRWISAPLWTPMGCRGTAASPWAVPGAAGESLLQHLGHLPPLLLR